MAATRMIEEESGTYTGFVHPHNGYYAGDFSRRGAVVRSTPTRNVAQLLRASAPASPR